MPEKPVTAGMQGLKNTASRQPLGELDEQPEVVVDETKGEQFAVAENKLTKDDNSSEKDISFPGKTILFKNVSKFWSDEEILINSIGNKELLINLILYKARLSSSTLATTCKS